VAFNQTLAHQPQSGIDVRDVLPAQVAREPAKERLRRTTDQRYLDGFPGPRADHHVIHVRARQQLRYRRDRIRPVRVSDQDPVEIGAPDTVLERRAVAAIAWVRQYVRAGFRRALGRVIGRSIIDYDDLVIPAGRIHDPGDVADLGGNVRPLVERGNDDADRASISSQRGQLGRALRRGWRCSHRLTIT